MGPWTFVRIHYMPVTLGLVFAFGLVICFVISTLLGDVSPFMPFISETGGKYPEAGIFSIFLYLSSVLGIITMTIRYLIVDELNRGIERSIDLLNRISVVIGFIALMGMVVVAAYPMTSIGTAHGIGANVLFIGGIIYASLQTAVSFKMSPYYNGKTICYIRCAISVFSSLVFIILFVLGPIAIKTWNTAYHQHWTGSKTPLDAGFDLLLVSSVAEWMLAVLLIAFFFTFVREFRKVLIHLRVQLLVQHFDEEPCDTQVAAATERTPIVM